MKKATSLLLALSLVASTVLLTGCFHEHTWTDATCDEPKTCNSCGETEGGPLGHTWVDATCTTPKTCSVCETTEGDLAEHIAGEWVESDHDYINCTYKKTNSCTECSEVLET